MDKCSEQYESLNPRAGNRLRSRRSPLRLQEVLRPRRTHRSEDEVNKSADGAVQDVVVLQDDEVLAGRQTRKDGR